MFPTIVSYSALGIRLSLFYRKIVIAQLKKKRQKTLGRHTRLEENDDLPLRRALVVKKKPPLFDVRALIMREILRSECAQCSAKE